MPDISLKRISYPALEEILHIPSAAVNSSASPAETVSPAYSPAWDFASQAFGIYVENELVGVYCMTTASESDTLWLGGYLIEQRYRAHGYGQTTLLEILKKINQDHPYCNTINLAVEPENVVAQHLCQKKGHRPAVRRST
jgi:RimJ/RimL family protein N-acetyltransferase